MKAVSWNKIKIRCLLAAQNSWNPVHCIYDCGICQNMIQSLSTNTWTFSFWQDFANLDVDDIMAKQVEQLEKEKKELMDRLKNQEKKASLGHLLLFPTLLWKQGDILKDLHVCVCLTPCHKTLTWAISTKA